MKTAVRSGKLVRIPDDIFRALGLREGMELDWQLSGGKLVAEPLPVSRELASRIRARARAWKLPAERRNQAEVEERRREMENDRREGRL